MLLVSNSLSNSFQCFQCLTVRSRLTVKLEWVNGLFHMILKNTDSDVQKVPYSSGSLFFFFIIIFFIIVVHFCQLSLDRQATSTISTIVFVISFWF